jgi:hypothetical protein
MPWFKCVIHGENFPSSGTRLDARAGGRDSEHHRRSFGWKLLLAPRFGGIGVICSLERRTMSGSLL